MPTHIPPSEDKHCPCGCTFRVLNVIDFDEDGSPILLKQYRAMQRELYHRSPEFLRIMQGK